MIVKLLTEHHLEFLSLKGGCRGLSESTLVKLLEISCRGSFIISVLFYLQASHFHKKWTTPPSESPEKARLYVNTKRGDCEKGMERIGR